MRYETKAELQQRLEDRGDGNNPGDKHVDSESQPDRTTADLTTASSMTKSCEFQNALRKNDSVDSQNQAIKLIPELTYLTQADL